LALGGVAPKPWRLLEVERFLAGKTMSAETVRSAATLAMKGARGYGHNDFKLKLTPRAIMQALIDAAEERTK
jgi:xanthine dehydrogenase YagS FAD-binding subunit